MTRTLRGGRRRGVAAVTAIVLATALLTAPAAADHEGDNGWPNAPDEDVRAAPPDDPGFDRAEEDAPASCFEPPSAPDNPPEYKGLDQQWEWFGFAPACAPLAIYRDGPYAGQPMVSGASVDRAWQVSTGRPDVVIAVLDTGIDWGQAELDTKVWLNAGELPDATDRNANGVIDVLDFCTDTTARFGCEPADVLVPDANPPDPGRGRTEVGNGLLDAQDILLAASDGVDDDGNGYVDDIAGWDFFDDDNDPHDISSHASARNHGTGRAEEAAAETNNGQNEAGSCPDCLIMPLRIWDTFIPDTNTYAAGLVYATDNGAKITEASIGAFTDTTFAFDAHAYAWHHDVLPVVVSSDLNTAHHDYPASDAHTLWINGHVPDTFGSDVSPTTWFRQSNITQYGAHAHVGIGGSTGSQATGKASGVVALLAAHARDVGSELSANELKQLVTMTAEDVLPANTQGVGQADPSQEGWDQYFGYGRMHARDAIDAITEGAIPPEVFIERPGWFRLLDPAAPLVVEGTVAARGGSVSWELQAAPGIEPTDDEFVVLASGDGPIEGVIATVAAGELADLFPDGFDFGAPPSDPDQFDVTLRVQATDADGLLGEDRRMVYLRDDPHALPGWPLEIGPSMVASPRMWDLDLDGELEILLGDADGFLRAFDPDGAVVWEYASGAHPNIAPHAAAPGLAELGVPRNPWLTPLIADLDDDLAADVIAADGSGTVHRLTAGGELVWTRTIDKSRSLPEDRERNHASATGFLGSPAVGDVDGDGRLDIVAGDMAGDLYVWDADGRLHPGYPLRLRQRLLVPDDPYQPDPEDDYDVKIIVSPVLADLDPDVPGLEIVVPTNEYLPNTADTRSAFEQAITSGFLEVIAAIRGVPAEALAEIVADVDSITYALHGDGSLVDGWPVRLPTAAGTALPLIAPSVQPTVGDLDGDGALEVFTSAVTAPTVRLSASGEVEQRFATTVPGPASDTVDRSGYIQFLEWPALGDLDRDGGLEAFKGAISLNALLNLVIAGQNLPQDHVVQAWDGATGEYLPAYPRSIVDWQILIAPGVADVGGGATNQVLVGNGLYTLDAFGPDGAQPAGWPKFTGGWMVTSPAVGDLDGDGTVEVVATTREGYAHAWSTEGAAAHNDEWWSFHHDERSSGTYGTDTRPPNVILDAEVTDGVLTFTAPGDDWMVGTAAAYQVRTSSRPITSFQAWSVATPVPDLPDPAAPGTTESVDLPSDAGRFVAVVAVDDAGNRSSLAGTRSPAPQAPTPPLPATGRADAWLALSLVALAIGIGRSGRRTGR